MFVYVKQSKNKKAKRDTDIKYITTRTALRQTKLNKQLFDVFLLFKNSQEVKHFLFDLLSPKVLGEVARRFRVAEMLSVDTPYETIQKETGLSSATVASVSKWLKCGMGGYSLAINRLKQKAELRRQLRGDDSCEYPQNL